MRSSRARCHRSGRPASTPTDRRPGAGCRLGGWASRRRRRLTRRRRSASSGGLRGDRAGGGARWCRARERGHERTGPVPQPVLAQLRDFDRGDDRGPSGAGDQPRPGLGGVRWRPSRRRTCARSIWIRSAVQGSVELGRAGADRARPDGLAARRSPPVDAATTTAPRRPGRGRTVLGADRSAVGATGRSIAASRQSRASPSRRSRANARPSPPRSPGGASARTVRRHRAASRDTPSASPSERTSWSLWRTTSASSVAGAPARKRR